VFRRRQRQGPPPGEDYAEAEAGWEAEEDATGEDGQPGAAGGPGPWDAASEFPADARMDFGSLLVPLAEGTEVQVGMAGDEPVWVTVVHGDSGLQLQAFAAAKSGGLWDDVRAEIAADVAQAGGSSEEAAGPFGPEVHARISPPEPPPGAGQGAPEPVRFLGVDGPRWFLRGMISGPAARRPELATPLEEVFAGVVVVRGDHPAPPRDLLPIRLPEEARQALGEAGEPEDGEPEASRWAIGPLERGPEITETR
jgi:uncharacterized protein DUF3710